MAASLVFHVTLTRNTVRIRKEGLKRFQPRVWAKAGTGKPHELGFIYAFEDEQDARRWAAKMDWELHQQSGSKKVSVIRLMRLGGWDVDTADPLSQAGSRGKWLKRNTDVAAYCLCGSYRLHADMVKLLVEHQCSVCGGSYSGLGHNAQPLSNGRCCDACNGRVLLARAEQFNAGA